MGGQTPLLVTTNSNECGAVKSFGLHVLEPSLSAGAGICMQTNQVFGEDVRDPFQLRAECHIRA
eukprot:scaffold2599_cov74-Phaeocystis_antarctica.AAC.4